jgi:hypothetical protein
MDIIYVLREITFIANGVLPVATLPDTALSLGRAALRYWLIDGKPALKC